MCARHPLKVQPRTCVARRLSQPSPALVPRQQPTRCSSTDAAGVCRSDAESRPGRRRSHYTLGERCANGPAVVDVKNADCGSSQLQGSDCEPFMITAAECVGRGVQTRAGLVVEMLVTTSHDAYLPLEMVGESVHNVTSPVLSCPLVDSGCKNKNQAKREKRRPPGTVEFIVSEAATRWRRRALGLKCFCPV